MLPILVKNWTIKESFTFHNPQNVLFFSPFFGWFSVFVPRQEFLDAKMDADAAKKTHFDLRREANKSAEVKDLVLGTRDALQSSSTARNCFFSYGCGCW